MWIRSACLDTIRTGIRRTECQLSPDSCMNLSLRLLTDLSARVDHNRNFLLELSDRLPQRWRSNQLLVFRPCFSLQMLVLHRVTQTWINLAARNIFYSYENTNIVKIDVGWSVHAYIKYEICRTTTEHKCQKASQSSQTTRVAAHEQAYLGTQLLYL